MKACGHCKQEAGWRYKDGWGVLACADWFSGKCEGEPLDITPPSVGNTGERGQRLADDLKFYKWMNKRIRELWPLEPPV
jgi:hypothetical protein